MRSLHGGLTLARLQHQVGDVLTDGVGKPSWLPCRVLQHPYDGWNIA